MLDSEIGFTDRGGEQLFEADPGNRCFSAAAQGNNWLKMEGCIPFHTITSPFQKTALRRALFTTQSFMSTKHVQQQTAQQNNRRHPTAVWPPGTSLIIKEEWHVEERGRGQEDKSHSYKLTNQLINLKKNKLCELLWASFPGEVGS